MEESEDMPDVTPELYFLIAKFLSGGPLKETAKTLIKELNTVEVLPRRIDWLGKEHPQSYDDILSQHRDMPASRLASVCARLLRRPGPRRSLLGERLVRDRPRADVYTEGASLVRRLLLREVGMSRSAHGGGRALLSPGLLGGLGLQRRTLGHLSAVYCLVFDRAGRFVVTGADDLLVKVWSAIDGRLLATLRGAGAEITDVCLTADGELLAAGSVDRLVRVWRLDTGAPAAVLTAHSGTVTAVHWAPSASLPDRILASASTDGSVAFWWCSRDGTFSRQPVQYVERTRPGPCQMICAAWSAGGCFLAAGSADHHVRVYHVEPGGCPRRVLETAAHSEAVDSVSWAHRSLRFVSGSKDGGAALWAVGGGAWRPTLLLAGGDKVKLRVTMVQWDRSDAFIVTALSDRTVRVWCAYRARQLRSLKPHTDEAYVLEAHPCLAGVFLSAGHDGLLAVWDAATGETISSFQNKIEGQGCGAIFDAKWGTDCTIAASDSHGHLLLLGLGKGHKLFSQLPTELFFHTDYRPLARDALGGALDEQTQTPPHLMPPPFLVDVEGAPHPPPLQRLVPGRERASAAQLVPRQEHNAVAEVELLQDGEALPPPSVWRGSGVRRTAGEWQSVGAPPPPPAIMPPPSEALREQLERAAEERTERELEDWKRELRRRPIMITTSVERGGGGRRGRGGRPRGVRAPPSPPAPPSPASPSDSDSDLSVRLSGRSSPICDDSSEDSSCHYGVKYDNSGSSSQYSDWEAAGERLAPPRRTRRRHVQPVKRYSPSTSALKKSTPTPAKPPAALQPGPSVDPSTATGPAATAATTVTTADGSQPPPASELPEPYRVGDWLTSVVPRKSPYFPQIGDVCVYFRLGHQRYFEAVSEKDVYRVNPRDKPWERTTVRECEIVKVVGVKYTIKPPRIVSLRLSIVEGGKGSFTARYHDMADVIDFLVLKDHFDTATNIVWSPGDKFRCLIDDQWWFGTVLESSGPGPSAGRDRFHEHFLSMRVRWDNGELERVSPWDIDPPSGSAPPSPGRGVPLRAGEVAGGPWRAGGSIARHMGPLMSLAAAEPFLAPVDLQVYPSYAMVVPYPIDLATIKARFENNFYRRAAAAQFDARYLASNAELFNRPHAHIVRQARLLTDLLLDIISNYETVDVMAKYHELANNYHSTDDEEEAETNDKPGSEWRPRCLSLLERLMSSPDAEPFREPVDRALAPDYDAIVPSPLDLGQVRSRLASGRLRSAAALRRDVLRVFSNSRLYNTNKRSRIYSMTVRLSSLFSALWAKLPRHVRNGRDTGPPPRSDSWDSDAPLHSHKGKGVGKKSKVPSEEPSTSRVNGHATRLPPTSSSSSDENDEDEEPPDSPELPVLNIITNGGGNTHMTLTLNGDRGGSESSSSSSSSSAPPDDRWSPDAKQRLKRASGRKRGRRKRSEDSDDLPRKRPAPRERAVKWSSSSNSPSDLDLPSDMPSDMPPDGERRYESDHSYQPDSSDDDQPLQLYRQRHEDLEEAGPSRRRRHKTSRPRPRYNEQSDSDSTAAIAKRGRAPPPARPRPHHHPALAQLESAPPPDHAYYTARGDDGENEPVSISSRGRVRKLTAKARGLLRE